MTKGESRAANAGYSKFSKIIIYKIAKWNLKIGVDLI
jgi:hypothetical protein